MLTQRLKIYPAEGTWVIRAGGAVIGESANALELVEGEAAPVIYFPREDVGMAFLEPSEATSAESDIGQARHFDIVIKSGVIRNAAWSYETPAADVERVAGHIAFHAHKVTLELL